MFSNKPSRARLAAMVLAALPLASVAAGDDENPSAAWLLGDWAGGRTALSARGIELELVATVDVLGNASGGLDQGVEAPSNFDVAVEVDAEKAFGWSGGRLRVYLLGNAGGDTNTHVGALQVASNIEAPDTFKLYEAFYEQKFFGDRASVLVGLHDLNSEFYVTDLSGVFLNSSFGVGQEVAQIGPSISPTTAMAGRLWVAPTAQTYLMGAVYDGVPGNPNDPYGTHVDFARGDGVLTIGETGFRRAEGRYAKLAFGGWHQTEFDNLITGARGDNHGYYVVGEIDLWRDGSGRGVGVFGQLGFARDDRNQTDLYAGGGINWTGPFASRPADVAGVAFAHARNGDDFLDANPGLFTRSETLLELTYAIQVTQWLLVQPDLQYFIEPGTDRALDDAVVIGSRVQVVF